MTITSEVLPNILFPPTMKSMVVPTVTVSVRLNGLSPLWARHFQISLLFLSEIMRQPWPTQLKWVLELSLRVRSLRNASFPRLGQKNRIADFQATRLSLADLKTRGFPSPPLGGFGFICKAQIASYQIPVKFYLLLTQNIFQEISDRIRNRWIAGYRITLLSRPTHQVEFLRKILP